MEIYTDALYLNAQHYGEVLISVMSFLFISFLLKACLLESTNHSLIENINTLEKRIESLEQELEESDALDEDYEDEEEEEEDDDDEEEEEEEDEDYEYVEEEEDDEDTILKSYALNDGSHIYHFIEFDNDNIIIVYTTGSILINCKRVVSIRDTTTDLNPQGDVVITYITPYGIKKRQTLPHTSEESKDIIKFLRPLL